MPMGAEGRPLGCWVEVGWAPNGAPGTGLESAGGPDAPGCDPGTGSGTVGPTPLIVVLFRRALRSIFVFFLSSADIGSSGATRRER
jgi:hypothetical protein